MSIFLRTSSARVRACLKLVSQSEVTLSIADRRRFSTRKRARITRPDFYTVVEPQKQEVFVFTDFEEPVRSESEDSKEKKEEVLSERHDCHSEPPQKNQTHTHHHKTPQRLPRIPSETDIDVNSFIDFQDVGFPLEVKPGNLKKHSRKIYGSPDAEVDISDFGCTGCGAILHCRDSLIPGYLPSEKYKKLVSEDQLSQAVCQRCFLMTHHKTALDVSMKKEEYRAIVRKVRAENALILLIVDLLDIPDSIIPDLYDLVGKNKHVVVLGNKVDLIPGDAQNYLQRIRRQLMSYCGDVGISTEDPKDYHLISAKTGYGIEPLISRLQSKWKYKGDVYLVGMSNAGKSTLFNTLLDSDYCKTRAADVLKRATISPWPGTTLNLLKFPILNPTGIRLQRRAQRLSQSEQVMSDEELRRIKEFSKQGYLTGHVGRTFRADTSARKGLVEFDADLLSFGGDLKEDVKTREQLPETELSYNEIKDARWLYDTPGIIKEHDILSLLSEQEVKLVVPTHAISPRSFNIKPGSTLLLGGLVRIDYVEGKSTCWFTVVASSRVPVHLSGLERAEAVYNKHAGNTLLAVPCGGEERMKMFPALVLQEFKVKGCDSDTATTDIKISSIGWVAVTADKDEEVLLHVYAPESYGVTLRSPPLLPHIVRLKGKRIRKSSAFKAIKPPALIEPRERRRK